MLVIIVGVMVAFSNLAVVAEVVFAEQVLRSGPGGYSILVAGFTSGMVVGTLAGGRLPQRWLLVAALAGTLATGAGIAAAGAAAVLWQATVAYGFGGLAGGVEVVATRSFLNHRAPEAVAGRVFALYSGVLFGAASVGMAFAACSPRLAPAESLPWPAAAASWPGRQAPPSTPGGWPVRAARPLRLAITGAEPVAADATGSRSAGRRRRYEHSAASAVSGRCPESAPLATGDTDDSVSAPL